MHMEIIYTNSVTILFLLGTILVLLQKSRANHSITLSKYQLLFSFFILIVGTVFDSLYHLGYGELFDTYGEYLCLLFFPLIIFSILTYLLGKELERRVISEHQLQDQNVAYVNINKKLAEGNEKYQIINDALSKKNMELDSFVYRVSHDLRAPICTAMGLTNLSQTSNDINEIKSYLSLQEKSLSRLDHFIRDILDYSKNNHTDNPPSIIDFNELVDSAFQDYQTASFTNVSLIKKFDVSTVFYSDPLRLKIIFNNLISNAIKFQRKEETNKYVEVTVHSTMDHVTIIVKDNGTGIHDEFKKDVFKIFFRATNINSGSGLGLYIVNDCVNKLNGQIELQSQYNVGTSIMITLPNNN